MFVEFLIILTKLIIKAIIYTAKLKYYLQKLTINLSKLNFYKLMIIDK